VGLDRYTSVIPDLKNRSLPLDAAIDISLRSLAGQRGARNPSLLDATRLADLNPAMRGPILEALALSEGLLATSDLRRVDPKLLARPLPSPFGPQLEDGQCRYTLTRLLGSGSSGAVFAAIDRHLSDTDRPALVAVKILSRTDDPWQDQRLTEEATKARRVEHPNVVRVVDRGTTSDLQPFVVYELIEGSDLHDWFESRTRRIAPREAAQLMIQVARGVQAAHAAGLIHSDLKPANILISNGGVAKVADFGVAARLHAMEDSPTGNSPIGNMAFIAPEQFRGEHGHASAPADVYAIGGLLYYLLTGELPNGATVESVAQNHSAVQGRTEAPSARQLDPDIPPELDAICRRAMAADPARRYPSAAEFADDLQAWIEFRPIAWMRPGHARVLRLWARRRPGLAVALGVLVLVLFGASISVGYYGRIAEEKSIEAAKAKQRLQETHDAAADAIRYLDSLKANGQHLSPEESGKLLKPFVTPPAPQPAPAPPRSP
jgi:serine/threonine protein kinase